MEVRVFLILYWFSDIIAICTNYNLDDLQTEIKKIGLNVSLQLRRFSLIKKKIDLFKQIGDYNDKLVELYISAIKNRTKVKEIIRNVKSYKEAYFIKDDSKLDSKLLRFWKGRDLELYRTMTSSSQFLWNALSNLSRYRVVVGSNTYQRVLDQKRILSNVCSLNDMYIKKRKYMEDLSDSSWEETTNYPYFKLRMTKMANFLPSRKSLCVKDVLKLWTERQTKKVDVQKWLKQMKRFSYGSTLMPSTVRNFWLKCFHWQKLKKKYITKGNLANKEDAKNILNV